MCSTRVFGAEAATDRDQLLGHAETPPPDGSPKAYQYGGVPGATDDVFGTPQGNNPPLTLHTPSRQAQNRNIHEDTDVVFVCTDMEGSTAMAAANAVRLRSLVIPYASLKRA